MVQNRWPRERKNVDPEELYTRRDGKVTFSERSAVIADTRKNAQNGRIQRVLGNDGTFSDAFRDAILDDHQDILEQVYLETELKNYKRVIQALSSAPDDKQVVRLLRKIHRDPTQFKGANILCPIWKNRRIYNLTSAAIPRYLFPEKSSELYLVTIIFGFAENLFELEQAIYQARQDLDAVINALTKKRYGLFIAGCFEPDLKTYTELTKPNSGNTKLLQQLGIRAPDSGGWILTGHFIIRAPIHNRVRDELTYQFPSIGWKRVQFDQIDKSKTLAQHMIDILGYAGKYPAPIFKYQTRGNDKQGGDQQLNAMQTSFLGPSFRVADDKGFGIDTAIRQWSLFMDQLGEKNIYYAKESTHAQKWYSQSEWKCIRENDDDLFQDRSGSTLHKIELHRDTEFYSNSVRSNLKGRCKRLKTRNLRYDDDWHIHTDMGEGPFTCVLYSYDRWILMKQ